jgi:hypothetical protein
VVVHMHRWLKGGGSSMYGCYDIYNMVDKGGDT